MKKIKLGKTGLMVSCIGFGSIPIQRISEDKAITVIERCLDLGINFLDTANGYTTSEERIGKVISGQRDKIILATKSMAQTPDEIKSHLELSLKRLGTEYIELYLFHNVSDANTLKTILDPNGPRAVIEEAKKSGVVRHIGFSSHQIDIAREAVKSGYFEIIMFPFNFIFDEAKDKLLPLVRERGMGFIGMKPLAGGMIDKANLAIKYVLRFPDVIPMAGIETVNEIEEIAKIVEEEQAMTEDEQAEMERIKQEVGSRFCRRCDYCQPCTQGISISGVMSYPTLIKRINPERLFVVKWFTEPFEKATECIDCGECEERCPYQLPIREMMTEYVSQYEAEKKKYEATLNSD
ncbi:aldo/keto reductase [Chloroflexota bacterium]